MTKKEFLQGIPFKALGQTLRFDDLGEVDRPLKGCITKLSSYRFLWPSLPTEFHLNR